MLQAMRRFTSVFVLAFACLMSKQAAHAQDSPSDVVTRLERLEETVRDLTGQVQELQYHNQQLEQEVQRLQGGAQVPQSPLAAGPAPSVAPSPAGAPLPRSSVSTSLPPPTATPYSTPPQYSQSAPTARYGQQPPQYGAPPQYGPPPSYVAPAAPVVANEPTGRHDAFNPALDPNAPGVPHALGTSTTATEPPPPAPDTDGGQPGAPLNLSVPQGGALPPPPLANPNATGAMQGDTQVASLPPNATPKEEYDLAYGYVLQKNYGPAAQAFRDFLREYPSDRLTPEAQYWLGESLFDDQKYHDAAEAFLTVSTKYGTSAKAPDALLRLGQSLAALGEKEAACASLGEVLRKYPHASISVKQSVDREQKRVHC